jgi:CheY-like chemotaxis protein
MRPTIFYIDDDKDDVQMVEEILNDLGEASCVFHHATDLMHLLNNPPPSPSMILIDLNMPVVDGIEVLDTIRADEKFDSVPVIMMSNTVPPSKLEECREHGANLFMTKGYTMRSIKSAFQHLLKIDWNNFDPDTAEFLIVA